MKINTEGLGQFAYAPEGENVEFDEEFPTQSAIENLPEPKTFVIKAKPDEGWKFVKWTKDGETVAKLVKYFWEEGAAEGVRGDIALAQSIHETGWFQFGNLVKPDQYNFAGLGATGPGHPGNKFPDARTGIRAQIQHLKAYASTASLKQTCVDVRFDYVQRGCAPTIAGLSGKWAVPGGPDSAGMYYHDYLIRYLKGMLAS